MKQYLLRITDKKTTRKMFMIVDSVELYIRDMRTHYSKTQWKNMENDLEFIQMVEIDTETGETDVYLEGAKKYKLKDFSYETGERL